MPTPTPPTLPPNVPGSAADLILNGQGQQQEQVIKVTPNESNTFNNLDTNADSNSQGTGVGSANAISSPVINGTAATINSQVNSGYGEPTEECMENVGCQSTMSIDMVAYYGGSDIRNSVNNFSNSNSDFNNYGFAVRFLVPLGNGFDGKLDELAIEEVKKRQAEQMLLQQEIVKRNIELDKEVFAHCVDVRNPHEGKQIIVSPTSNPNSVANRTLGMCQGIEVAVAQKNDDIEDLIRENNRLRQKLVQLMNRGERQKIGN